MPKKKLVKGTLKGRIFRVKYQEDKYGNIRRTMAIKGKGWTAWGSVPEDINPKQGHLVEVDADINWRPGGTFAYFYRPRNAKIIEDEE